MVLYQQIKKFFSNPIKGLDHVYLMAFNKWISDEKYLKRMYKLRIDKELDLECPKTFNEKLQWLKLYSRQPKYTMMVDKYAVKKYIAEVIGEQYIIPTLGVWDNPDDIDFEQLPDQFVLKCTHNSGQGMYICTDKSKINYSKVRKELKKGLQKNYYWHAREWPYKDVQPQIIAEKYMSDATGNELRDYKIMCFNGEAYCVFVCSDRNTNKGLHITVFDREWKVMPFKRKYPSAKEGVPQPQNYKKMIALAETLAKDIPFVRVDFYEIFGKIYFGELTFFPGSGFELFYPNEWDLKLGQMIQLPKEKRE